MANETDRKKSWADQRGAGRFNQACLNYRDDGCRECNDRDQKISEETTECTEYVCVLIYSTIEKIITTKRDWQIPIAPNEHTTPYIALALFRVCKHHRSILFKWLPLSLFLTVAAVASFLNPIDFKPRFFQFRPRSSDCRLCYFGSSL